MKQRWIYNGRATIQETDYYLWSHYPPEADPITGFTKMAYAAAVASFWPETMGASA